MPAWALVRTSPRVQRANLEDICHLSLVAGCWTAEGLPDPTPWLQVTWKEVTAAVTVTRASSEFCLQLGACLSACVIS